MINNKWRIGHRKGFCGSHTFGGGFQRKVAKARRGKGFFLRCFRGNGNGPFGNPGQEADNMDVGLMTETDLRSDLMEGVGNPF